MKNKNIAQTIKGAVTSMMMAVGALLVVGPVAFAKEPAKLAVCAACHGKNGIGTQPKYPHLVGQQKVYMVTQLKAFKSGERKNAEMQPMAVMLSDAEMEELSAYYAGLKK